jgi:hypothetical protein
MKKDMTKEPEAIFERTTMLSRVRGVPMMTFPGDVPELVPRHMSGAGISDEEALFNSCGSQLLVHPAQLTCIGYFD